MRSSYCEESVQRLRQSIQERSEQCQRDCQQVRQMALQYMDRCRTEAEEQLDHYQNTRVTLDEAQQTLVRRVRWAVILAFGVLGLLGFITQPDAYTLFATIMIAIPLALGAGFVAKWLAYLPNAFRIHLRDQNSVRKLDDAYNRQCDDIQNDADRECERLLQEYEAYVRQTQQQIDRFKATYLEQIKASRKRLASSRHLLLLSQEVLKVFAECAKGLTQPGDCMQLELDVRMDRLTINRMGKVKRQPLYQKAYYDLDLQDLPDPASASALCILLCRSVELEMRMSDDIAIRQGTQNDGFISLQMCR